MRTEQITARFTKKQKKAIDVAARKSEKQISVFVAESALEKANYKP